jgi:SAM-dependent methyltransferase
VNLTDLFDKYGSDKGTAGHSHGYAASYELLIPRSTQRIVELGIGTHLNFNGSCGSILAWLEWLESGIVYGFDINDPTVEIKSERFRFVKGDQGSREDLEKLAREVGQCDAIIDDGSHLSQHQLLSLDVLWNCLKPGGVYVIEDAHFRWGDPPHPIDSLKSDSRFEGLIGNGGRAVLLRKPDTLEPPK